MALEQEWHGAAAGLWDGCRAGPLRESLEKAILVMAPHCQMIREGDLPAVESFLRRGGTFITTADFGRLNGENNVRPSPPLGAVAPLLAVPARETLHLKEDFRVHGEADAMPLSGRNFWFVPAGSADVHLEDGAFAGPAWLEYPVGRGRVVIFTSAFDRASLGGLLKKLTA